MPGPTVAKPGWIRIARLISILYHPGILATLLLMMPIFLFGSPILPVAFTLLFVLVLPIAMVSLYLRLVSTQDFYVIRRSSRWPLFVINIVCLLVWYWLMVNRFPQYLATDFFIVVLLLNVLGLGITLFWKISIHMIGLSAVLGLAIMTPILSDLTWLIPLGLLSLPVVAWARWYLGSHDGWQLLAGTALGLGLSTGWLTIQGI